MTTASPDTSDPAAKENTGRRAGSGTNVVEEGDPVATASLEWSPPPLSERRAWARRFGGLVAADTDELARLAETEIAKPSWETLVSDVMPLVAACRWHARRAGRILATRRPGGRPWWLLGQAARVHRAPLGRVGIIATWNYPLQLLGVQLVQAIVAGNRVVVKPSERTPRTQQRLIELALAAGVPGHSDTRPVLEAVSADREAGAALLDDPDLDHVVFTGSTGVGRRVAVRCAERLLPSTLELSGCDTVVVLPDADPVLAARTVWTSLTLNHGRTCMAPRRVLVHRSVAPAFAAALVPLASGAAARSLADEHAATRHRDLVADAVRRGARLISATDDGPGDRVRAQVALDCPADARAFSDDHFGPLVVTAAWEDEADLLRLHRLGGKHLATSVFTADPRRADELAPKFGSGIVTINDTIVPTAHPATPIPATGDAGWGSSQGIEGLLAMTRPLVVTRTGRLRPPAGEPDPRSLAFLRGLVRRWGRGVQPPPAPIQDGPSSPLD